MKIYLIPLVKGNFNKDLLRRTKEEYYCCDYTLTESSTFKDVFELLEVSEKLEHISDIVKMVSVHDCIYNNCSHGPYSLMYEINDKIKASTESLFIVYPSVEDVRSIVYPPALEIITEKTPLILLDVDGVINEYGSSDPSFVSVDVMMDFHTFNIKYDPEKIKKINEWAQYAEVRFLTSWGHFATYRLAPTIGLYSFPRNYTLKRNLCDLSEEDAKRPIIWVDDEIGGIYPLPLNFKDIINKFGNIHVIYTPSYLKPYHFEYIQMLINPQPITAENFKLLLDTYISDYRSTSNDLFIIFDNFKKFVELRHPKRI